MEKTNNRFEMTIGHLVCASLFILSLGLLTSVSILAVSHILIAIPCLYFLPKTNWRGFSISSWALIAMTIGLIISVVANQDIISKGYSGAFKTKYFVIGALSIVPFSWYFLRKLSSDQRTKIIRVFLYTICLGATVSTITGLIGMHTGYNPILMKQAGMERNGGLLGIMNYAHNLSYLLIILFGLAFNKDEAKKYINYRFLIIFLIINIIGFYFTYTRGAWLALLAGIPFIFLKNIKNVIIAGIVVCAIGASSFYSAGSSITRSDSDNTRVGLWQAGIEMFKEKPVLGYGFYNYYEVSAKIKEKFGFSNPTWKGHAHNNVVEIFASAGLLAGIPFVIWLIAWFFEMFKVGGVFGRIGSAFVIVFFIGGLTQSTIILAPNLFFVLGIYALTQVSVKVLKS